MNVLVFFASSWYFNSVETGVTVVTMHVHSEPSPIESEWSALADRVGTVFSSRPSFVVNVARALSLDFEVVAIRRDGRLVASAALSLVRRGPFTLAKVIGTGLGVPIEFLSEDTEASDALLDAIASLGYMVDADSMITNDPTVRRLAQHPSWTVEMMVRERVPVIDLAVGQRASDIRSAKSLKRLRQYRSEVQRRSSFRVEEITEVSHLDARWMDILEVAVRGIAGTAKINYLTAPHGEFARDFLRCEARAGRLCIAGLVIDGRWAAHEIGLRTGARMEGWLTHYDPTVGRCQPGHQLIEWFANNHDELGVDALDQGVGVNEIKSAWATSDYELVRVSAVPKAWVMSGLLVRLLRQLPPALSRLRRYVQRFP